LATCGALRFIDASNLATPADCQSAIQQITNLRYDVIGPQGAKLKGEVISKILADIKRRRA
jgi:hypothetical protein